MSTKARILVVDDSATSAMTLASYLSADGYAVAIEESGDAALAAAAFRPPDLILLDLRMAGLSGIDVCRRLKAAAQTRSIPVIFISAATDTAEKVEGLDVGAVDFISKPVQRAELRARVRTHLDLRQLQLEAERHAAEVERTNARLSEELAERQRAEEALAQSLREKEGLLREVHHRVKNNLALIISLMRLEAGRDANEQTRAVLLEMQARIRSVVLLNEALYRTESYSRVRLADYLRQIATHLFQAQTTSAGPVRLVMDLAPVGVEARQAIPCGLIVNELVTNSLKHAFPNGRAGEVSIALARGGGAATLRVSDNGIGLPPDLGSRRSQSLGLQLVSDLARQLGGSLETGAGATFTISFPSVESGETSAIPRPR